MILWCVTFGFQFCRTDTSGVPRRLHLPGPQERAALLQGFLSKVQCAKDLPLEELVVRTESRAPPRGILSQKEMVRPCIPRHHLPSYCQRVFYIFLYFKTPHQSLPSCHRFLMPLLFPMPSVCIPTYAFSVKGNMQISKKKYNYERLDLRCTLWSIVVQATHDDINERIQ